MKAARLLGGASAAMLLWSCMLGGGSDTETITPSLSGEVVFVTGAPTAGARVKLFTVDHDPSLPDAPAPHVTYTDEFGRFTFLGLRNGALYNVIVSEEQFGLWGIAYGQEVGTPTRKVIMYAPMVMSVFLHEDADFSSRVPGRVVVIGTDIVAESDGVHAASVDSLPHGARELVFRLKADEWTEPYEFKLDYDHDYTYFFQVRASPSYRTVQYFLGIEEMQ